MRVLLFILFCLMAPLISAKNECLANSACAPFASTRCTRGGRMDLRFTLRQFLTTTVTTNGNTTVAQRYSSWGFCPIVDQLQAFNLSDASIFAAGLENSNSNFNGTVNETYISVFGMGNVGEIHPGPGNDAYVKIFENTTLCPSPSGLKGEGGPAMVSFLVLNFTMSNGLYTQVPSFNQSVQVGFLPTCDEFDVCKLGTGVCIGNYPGRKNCAKCYNNVVIAKAAKITVWGSYYGTDANGRSFSSGGSNPLNFEQYSETGVFDKLESSLHLQ